MEMIGRGAHVFFLKGGDYLDRILFFPEWCAQFLILPSEPRYSIIYVDLHMQVYSLSKIIKISEKMKCINVN